MFLFVLQVYSVQFSYVSVCCQVKMPACVLDEFLKSRSSNFVSTVVFKEIFCSISLYNILQHLSYLIYCPHIWLVGRFLRSCSFIVQNQEKSPNQLSANVFQISDMSFHLEHFILGIVFIKILLENKFTN